MTRTWLERVLILFSVCAVLACGGAEATQADKPVAKAVSLSMDDYPLSAPGVAPGASAQVRALAGSLGAGINFGDMLDAPTEGAWGLKVEDEFIGLVGSKWL